MNDIISRYRIIVDNASLSVLQKCGGISFWPQGSSTVLWTSISLPTVLVISRCLQDFSFNFSSRTLIMTHIALGCMNDKSLQSCPSLQPYGLQPARQGHWSGLPIPPPGDLPEPGSYVSLMSPALAGGFFTINPTCIAFTQLLESAGFGKFGEFFTIISLNTFSSSILCTLWFWPKIWMWPPLLFYKFMGLCWIFSCYFFLIFRLHKFCWSILKLVNFVLYHHWSPPVFYLFFWFVFSVTHALFDFCFIIFYLFVEIL